MQIAFAVAAGVAAVTLLAVAFDRIRRRALVVLAVLAGLAAVAAWVGFGLRPGTSTATAAGGITIASAASCAISCGPPSAWMTSWRGHKAGSTP